MWQLRTRSTCSHWVRYLQVFSWIFCYSKFIENAFICINSRGKCLKCKLWSLDLWYLVSVLRADDKYFLLETNNSYHLSRRTVICFRKCFAFLINFKRATLDKISFIVNWISYANRFLPIIIWKESVFLFVSPTLIRHQ